MSDDKTPTPEIAVLSQNLFRSVPIRRLEKRLGLPEGYVFGLSREESDWAFIIKLAVLAEASVTHVLVAKVGNPLLYEHFSSITNTRRLQLAMTLGVLSKSDMRVLETLATTRNSFAHRVENLAHGSLAAYFGSLPGRRKAEIFNFLTDPSPEDRLKETDDFAGLQSYFKKFLLQMTVPPLISLSLAQQTAEQVQERATWLRSAYDAGEMTPIRNLMNLGLGSVGRGLPLPGQGLLGGPIGPNDEEVPGLSGASASDSSAT